MNQVAVVLYWWGDWPEDRPAYGERYVANVLRGLKIHTSVPNDVFLFSDNSKYKSYANSSFPILPMSKEFEQMRWNFKKLFMFSFESCLGGYEWVVCLDLDIALVGNIDFLLNHRSGSLMTCQAAYSEDIGGSIIGFNPQMYWTKNIVDTLRMKKELLEQKLKGSERKFYRWAVDNKVIPEVQYWQWQYPGRITSYKLNGGPSEDTAIVRFHGRPRPHEVLETESWMPGVWI